MRKIIVAAGAAMALVPTGVAQAQLGVPVPGAGAVVPGGAVPATGALGGVVTGTVGGVVGGVAPQVGGALDSVVGDVLEGSRGVLPLSALDQLLDSAVLAGLPGAPGTAGAPGASGAPGAVGADGAGPVVVDVAAPRAQVRVLSRLTQIGRTGSLRLEVSSDEAGVVAVGAAVRPGQRFVRKGRKKPRAKHSRKLIKVPTTALVFRGAGKLQMTVKLGLSARRTLARSRNAALGVAMVAADVRRNQASWYVKRLMKR